MLTLGIEELKTQLKQQGVFVMYGSVQDLASQTLPRSLNGKNLLVAILELPTQCPATRPVWRKARFLEAHSAKLCCQKDYDHAGPHADDTGRWAK